MNIGWVMGESRNWVTTFGQHLGVCEITTFPARTCSLRLRTTSLAQGWRMGLLRLATPSRGCLPGGRLPSGRAELVIRNIRPCGVLHHRAGSARRRDEQAIVRVPPDT